MLDFVMGLVRHGLTLGGGAIITSGYATQDDVTAAIGAITALVGVVWSAVSKHLAKEKLDKAIKAPAGKAE